MFLQNYRVLGFSRILRIILLKKSVKYVYSRMDRVHGLRLMSLWATLNNSHLLMDQQLRLKHVKGYQII
jgi:hypothetical protein